jgi:hypothetical protein
MQSDESENPLALSHIYAHGVMHPLTLYNDGHQEAGVGNAEGPIRANRGG